MKKLLFGSLFLVSTVSFGEEIIVYGPESMKWIESSAGKIFKEKTGADIKYIPIDGLIPRMKLEKKRPKADIVVGLTDINYLEAKNGGLIKKYKPSTAGNIAKEEFIIDKDWSVTPMDYGMLALNYNYENLKSNPKSFEDLKKYPKELLVQDPRGFTGEGFMLWTIAVYGDRWLEFWKELKPSILTVTSGWSDSFAKFSVGEGNIMSGYASSSLYFYQDGNENKYKSYIPEEGGYVYIEGAALVNKKEIKPSAEKFLDFVLEYDFQKLALEKNYMFPVIEYDFPVEYKYVPKTEKIVRLNAEYVNENMEKWKKQLIEVLKK
ncbi:thiamine ABC transporter substrate-binding protein [uncultured Cetobacterium sp.]|uniref:thiamine ABC transporter substrate-binding protein n=1 Tax=uncultured Cetobacterium sp. TaxID=527638 RepID=UPI0026059FCB|nr:thiamine ABC transporter substrate-binding protein [uncultured Cetobacterium sp.]